MKLRHVLFVFILTFAILFILALLRMEREKNMELQRQIRNTQNEIYKLNKRVEYHIPTKPARQQFNR